MQTPISFQGTFRNIKVIQEQKYNISPDVLEKAQRDGVALSELMETHRGHLEWEKDITPILNKNRNVCTGYSSVTTPSVQTRDSYTPSYKTYILSTEGFDPAEVKAIDNEIDAALQRRSITGYSYDEDSNFEEACGSDNKGFFKGPSGNYPIGGHDIDNIHYPNVGYRSYGPQVVINYPGSPAHIRHYFNKALEKVLDEFKILPPAIREQWQARLNRALADNSSPK